MTIDAQPALTHPSDAIGVGGDGRPDGDQAAAPRVGAWSTWRAAWARPAAVGAVAVVGGSIAAQGGLWTLAGLAIAGLGTAVGSRLLQAGLASARPSDGRAASASTASAGPIGDDGNRALLAEVVPVWRRQLEAARGATEDGFNDMVQAFARLSDGLGQLSSQAAVAAPAHAGAGAADAVISARPELLDQLMGPMQRAVEQRDAAAAALAASGQSLLELERVAKESKALARHTRMVATNAAIEAKRIGGGTTASGGRGGRFDAVAAEIRALADQTAQLGESMQRHIGQLRERFEPIRRHAEVHDIQGDELRIEARMTARLVLAGLMQDLAMSLQASTEMRDLASQLREDVDAVFMGFQGGDRVSQMLEILQRDLKKLVEWNASHDSTSRADIEAWLTDLEATYTMSEQRNQHHNTVTVDADAGVEFF